MEKYTFLGKPFFYIFSLFFATWLVLKIENISPSDFGRHKSLFERKIGKSIPQNSKQNLKKIFYKYKYGIIDSSQLDHQLEEFLESLNVKSAN